MKLFTALLVAILMIITSIDSFSQTWQSNCNATPTSEMLFRQDINKLLIARLFATNSPYKDSIDLPTMERDSIASAIYAIYNMPHSAVKDTIMTIFGNANYIAPGNGCHPPASDSSHICTLAAENKFIGGTFSTKNIFVYAHDTTNWGVAWAMGNYTNTPIAELNNLMNRFNIQAIKKYTISQLSLSYYTLTCPIGINTLAFVKAFNNIKGIDSSSALTGMIGTTGDGNGIDISYDTNGIKLTYVLGCGDCPSGCTYFYNWSFLVHSFTDCSVDYLGSNYASGLGAGFCGGTVTSTTPVTIESFAITMAQKHPLLKWVVADEINIGSYEIEKSFDGNNFSVVGSVATLPESGSPTKKYQWQDVNPLFQTAFYRIKAIDKSGKFTYTNILKATMDDTKGYVNIYPNPVLNHSMQLEMYKANAGNYQFAMYNMAGKLIYQKAVLGGTGQLVHLISLPLNIAKGVYSVQIFSPSNQKVHNQLVTVE